VEQKVDISSELRFRTARSSGKGGQHVNKTETKVVGIFQVEQSEILSAAQQELVLKKLSTYINISGELVVASERSRSQLRNKEDVVKRINRLINKAIKPQKRRKKTRPTKASKEKRLLEKKRKSETKERRKKPDILNNE